VADQAIGRVEGELPRDGGSEIGDRGGGLDLARCLETGEIGHDAKSQNSDWKMRGKLEN
jgi:hypothetical protein